MAEDSSKAAGALQELWASAYEGWVGPPGASAGTIVYLRPVAEGESAAAPDAATAAWVEATLAVADKNGGVYGLTSFNPPGQDRPHDVNMGNNAYLEKELNQLCEAEGGRYWHSFGFAEDWHEKGFTVAAPEAKVVELARKYEQGAIYRFYRAPGGGPPSFMRATVPVCLPDTEADVPVVPCPRPGLDRADPLWAPSVEEGSGGSGEPPAGAA